MPILIENAFRMLSRWESGMTMHTLNYLILQFSIRKLETQQIGRRYTAQDRHVVQLDMTADDLDFASCLADDVRALSR